MRALALTLETITSHPSVEGKVRSAAAYLASQPVSRVAIAARFLGGTPLPRGSNATNVGRATLVELLSALVHRDRQEILRSATRHGDLGSAIAEMFEVRPHPSGPSLSLTEVHDALVRLGTSGSTARSRLLRSLLERASALEVKYLVKLLLGSMRTGVQEIRVEEAVALAFDRPLSSVRRANMLLGDIGLAAEAAQQDRLERVALRAFRPVRVMLAHPCDGPDAVLSVLSVPMVAEDKYDGIRAQAHISGSEVRLYSRALEDVTHSFPEVRRSPPGLEGEWILDGEIVAWLDGRCLSFSTLQQRLGRKQVPITLLLDAPVTFLAFDVLRAEDEDLIDMPLSERRRRLELLPERGPIRRMPGTILHATDEVAAWFEAAVRRGNEGAVFKDPESNYRPGSRGRAWVKLKRAVASVDVVVTAAEYGRGKRAGMLSDLIFAVRGQDGFVDSGRAYSGLTDTEIRSLTRHFKQTTTHAQGGVHRVEPSIVLEVAFDDISRSDRHPSGYALRFPRILRRRTDIEPDEISSVQDLERMFRAPRT